MPSDNYAHISFCPAPCLTVTMSVPAGIRGERERQREREMGEGRRVTDAMQTVGLMMSVSSV